MIDQVSVPTPRKVSIPIEVWWTGGSALAILGVLFFLFAKDDPQLIDNLTLAVARFEKRHIERVLRQTPEKKEAAKRLNIGLSSLYRKIEELKVVVPEGK